VIGLNQRLLHPLVPEVRTDIFFSSHCEIWEKGIEAISSCSKSILKNLYWFIWLASITCCSGSDLAAKFDPKFDPDRAFAHLKKQVEFGPRPSGSDNLQKTRAYLSDQFKQWKLEIEEQSFMAETPKGATKFVNIIARFPKPSFSFFSSKQKILIAAHYDTKLMPEIQFVGANDSASGTATVLEIARVISESKFTSDKYQFEFVLFDGEEAIEQYTAVHGLYGSRYYVENLKGKSELKTIRAVIVLDMVGDKELTIQIPNGDEELIKKVAEASKSLNYRDYYVYQPRPFVDDHYPFMLNKIPAIDLIDFDYGPSNRYWHTNEDTLDKVSKESLKIVGQTVLKMIQDFK
jgi:glutaminyl-peptide cyclotransferase